MLASCKGARNFLKLLRLHKRERNWNICALYHTNNGIYGYIPRASVCNDENIVLTKPFPAEEAFQRYGHRSASFNPLPSEPLSLAPEIKQHESAAEFQALYERYCGSLSAEFMHIENAEERQWFAEEFQAVQTHEFSTAEKTQFAKTMLRAQAFDMFLAAKFATVKRYGGEGNEAAMVFYDELFRLSATGGVTDVVVGIAHRGRLNLLACLLNLPPVVMFRKMKGKSEFPPGVQVSGDVLSHLTSSTDLQYGDSSVHVTMLPNPSHLEAVNPVCAGKVRARMATRRAGDYSAEPTQHPPSALCLQIHGDAAFSAQGVIAELFAMSEVPHYRVDGTVHLIINNQLGYTTEAALGRSSPYSSDVSKMVGVPVIRVNSGDPEAVARASRLAFSYRQRYRRDVIVDLICYRRWGHNELDDPTMTQPRMYDAIEQLPTAPNAYRSRLEEDGVCAPEELEETVQAWWRELSDNAAQVDTYVPQANHLRGLWAGYRQATPDRTLWDTGVELDALKYVGARSVTAPADMAVHPMVHATHVERRLERLAAGGPLDWATAEALAMGSLLHQGYSVRLSGEDVGRGTFSQRHVTLVDQRTEEACCPLNHLHPGQTAFIEVANSPLSEEAVLGFEYGYSVESPRTLVLWEAQFGDFYNGAQIIVDTFIANGEMKWLLHSGLVMLLPHGMDGTGPEHSSCRIERFLQLTDSKEDAVDGDNINLQVANPSTPAQYFHLLRRQMVRDFRKPLVVASPKTLLRLPAATSLLSELGPGTAFRPVLGDTDVTAAQVKRVVFCSGKHWYNLNKKRAAAGVKDTALVRLEELCPFPAEDLRAELTKYPNAEEFVWSQEEHRNQGAWTFVAPRFHNVVGRTLRYSGREVLGACATGVGDVHLREADHVVSDPFT